MEEYQHGIESAVRDKRKNDYLQSYKKNVKDTTNRASKLPYTAGFNADDVFYEIIRYYPIQNINFDLYYNPYKMKIQNEDKELHEHALYISKKENHTMRLHPKITQKRCREKYWSRTDNKVFVQNTQGRNGFRKDSIVEFKEDWCNSYGIDNIMVLFNFAKLMYETSQRLQYVTQNTQYVLRQTSQPNFFVISIELSHLRKLLNPMLDFNETSIDRIIPSPFHEQDNCEWGIRNKHYDVMNAEQNHPIPLNICVEKQSMKFNIVLCRIDSLSKSFLEALQTFLSMSKTIAINYESTNVPSLCIRNWYFQDIFQGYMLGMLLRNSKVNTLNYMRKLYYVLITGTTPNLCIEINIKLKNGIFMVYDNCLYQEINNWNTKFNKLYRKSMSMATLENIIKKRYIDIFQEKKLEAITYTNSCHSELNIGTKANCLEAESRTESSENLYEINYVSDCESLQTKLSKSSTYSLQKVNGATSLKVVDDEACDVVLTGLARIPDSDAFIKNIFEKSHVYNTNYLHSKKWITGVFKTAQETQNSPRDFFHYQHWKEMIYDKTLIQKHLRTTFDLYWEHVTSQSFYTLLIKTLGQSLGNIFFCTVLT